jgi:hypothetical protein
MYESVSDIVNFALGHCVRMVGERRAMEHFLVTGAQPLVEDF